MIDKKTNTDEQIQRMKALMGYGLSESKQPAYSSVEYHKVAADGRLYGIVREGAKYYIKVAKDAKKDLVAENFDYIGGFRNRKDNMFESFASAQRFFVEKMMCINESIDNEQKRVIAEAWDLDAKKEVVEEGTKKMQAEIARQREIMMNAQKINEGKACDMKGGCPKVEKMEAEEPKKNPSAPYTTVLKNAELKGSQEDNIKGDNEPVKGNKKSDKKNATNESTEVPLSSRKDPDYMDTAHGTEIGNSAPFAEPVEKEEGAVAEAEGGEEEKPEVDTVNEEVSLHDTDNQNSPAVGVGEKGDNAPYEELSEDVEDLDDEIEDDALEADEDLEDAEPVDADAEGEEIKATEVEEPEGDEYELEVDNEEGDDTNARLDALEDKLNQILDAISDMKYDDDETLYGDDEDDLDNDDVEGPIEPEEEEEEEYEVVESRSYKAMKKALREESDFGKHPAFQKKVMTTPANRMPEKEGQYDMNDDSAESEQPYATSKGSQAPFEVSPEAIENAITESVVKLIKKKLA